MRKNIVQFIKFGIVGCINTLITIVSFNIFLLLNFNYLIANCIAYFLGVINSYLLNSKLVFNTNYDKKILIKFLISNIVVLIINTGILYIASNNLGLNHTIGQILATGLGLIINFILSKFIVF